MVIIVKNAVLWDVTPSSLVEIQRFGEHRVSVFGGDENVGSRLFQTGTHTASYPTR